MQLERYAWLSVAAAVATITLKALAWWLTGSVGLLSDALESLVNLAAALLALSMLRLAASPPDADHPYGFSKAEYFSAGIEGLRPRPGRTPEKSSSPSRTNRSRQAFTVIGATPTSLAIRVFANPSDAINKTIARCTSRCRAVCEQINLSSTNRCSSVTRSGAVGERIPHPTAIPN